MRHRSAIVGKMRRWVVVATVFLARTSLPEIAFVATLVLSKYLLNIDFSYPSETVVPILLFAVLATAIFYVYRFFLHRVAAAHFASVPLLYACYSYQYVYGTYGGFAKALTPRSFETPFTLSIVFLLVLAVVFGVMGYAITRLSDLRRLRPLQLPKVLMFFLLFLFISQVIKVGIRLIAIYPELSYHYTATQPQKIHPNDSTKPDIYYIVLDRYASADALKTDYGFDNSSFLQYLSSQGFATRQPAYANYPFTMSSISSTLAMSYHTALGRQFGSDAYQTAFPYRDILNNPPVAETLKRDGYQYNQVSSWWDFTRLGVNADTNPTLSYRLRAFGATFYLSDLSRDILNKSIFSPWLTKGITVGSTTLVKYDLDRNPPQNFEAQITALKQISSAAHTQPQFTFVHVLMPHDPYVFDEDGTAVDYDSGRNDNGADEATKYVNQLKYLNTRMEDLLTYMRTKSPNAVIIIQADEGPYPKQFRFPLTPGHIYNPIDLPTQQMQQKTGIMASYYMPGVDADVVSANVTSSVNVFRFVLSHYLGYDLPLLPDCQFSAGNKYSVYSYKLITEKLTGTAADSRCSSL